MRAKRTLRVPTAAQMAVGATVLAFPATALAVAKNDAAASRTPVPLSLAATPASITYGAVTVVRGRAPHSEAGTRLELEYRPAGGHWRTVDHGRIHADGRFGMKARVARSGALEVLALAGTTSADAAVGTPGNPSSSQAIPATAADPAGTTTSATATTATATTPASPPPGGAGRSGHRTGAIISASQLRRIAVRPRLALQAHTLTAIAGQPIQIRGQLLPGYAGRRVVLELQAGRAWRPVAGGRTHRGGRFAIRYVPAATGPQRVRVAFRGDRRNSRAASHAALVAPMQYAEVSWYDDAGTTACGFHATYGIASRTLPCGSQVTLSYGGRTVTATVDDRGPFVYSRLYDLNQNVAGYLGMYGVATVLASV